PRGCGKELLSRLESAEIDYQIEDKRQTGKSIDVSFNGKLYPEQMSAASTVLANENGILSAATAFGKTVVGAYLISQRKVNTLILVHNVEIMNNWVTDLGRFLSINEDYPTYTTPSGRLKQRKSLIGTFSSQKNTLTGIIDIAMVSSLGKDDKINPLVTRYGMVIMDECHHGAAYTSESVLRAITAKYVYGLTATTKRDDGQERKMFMQLGPVRYKYTAKERVEKQGIGHYIYPRFTRMVDVAENISITEALSLVSSNELRNLQIVADVKECLHLGRTPIVMTKRKEHAAVLYDLLRGEAKHTFLLQGGGGLKERAKLRAQMAAVPADESLLVVAIGQYVGEGFNYPRLDTLFLAMPISFEGNVEQYAGRLNRDYEGKKDVIIFDYIDSYVPILERMYLKRLRTYKRIGFEICSKIADKQDVTNSIYDSATYSEIFSQDVAAANYSVIISSPGLGTSKVWQFIRQLPMILERGVKVIVITMSPSAYPEDAVKHQEDLVQILRSSGVIVKTQDNCKEHFAIIDESIVWYGSMNFLSSERDDDNIMRIESISIAQELLLRYAQKNG
ncbi:MAG: DEAD/DEAH box helicase family protein, partial [Candidatus Cryptobacteroides sp.]